MLWQFFMIRQHDCFAESYSFISTSSETPEIAESEVHVASSACFQEVIFWYYSWHKLNEPPRLEPKSPVRIDGAHGSPETQSPKD